MLDPDIRWQRVRLVFFALLIMGTMCHLVYTLYDVQVSRGQIWSNRLRDQTTVAVRLSPARGAILDRNGVALAENRASFDIDFYLDELVRNYSRQHRGRLPRIGIPVKRRGKTIVETVPDIVKIVNESMEPIAKSLGIQTLPNEDDLRLHYRIRRDIPFQFRADVDFRTMAQFAERNLGVPGITIAVRPVRHYNYGAFASHVIGYTGRPEQNDQVGEDGFERDSVGKQGVEKLMDTHMQGKPGGRILRVNYRGYIDREESMNSPSVGNSVYLTLDARIQQIVEECMRVVGRGAAVVMNPNNGDILAIASVPNFDPNIFIPSIPKKEFDRLNADATHPLFNRALSAYAPGSTYKVLIALAALKSKAITPGTVIFSPGAITIGNHQFKDWTPDGQGNITLLDGLRMSCNTFFYQVGIRAKIENIVALGDLCGFGQSHELQLPEDPGIMPGPKWMKEHYPKDHWSDAHTANVSIGQGFVKVTPVQMTVLMSAVGNGGTIYYPRLLTGVKDINGEMLVSIPERKRGELGVEFNDLAAVRQGLLAVVENGTGRRVGGIPGIKVAGKTGSAQFSTTINGSLVKDTRAWFYGFAPFENPRYAFCLVVEGGVAGGTTAGPIVHEILMRLFAMENGEETPLHYWTPAVGHFHGVNEISEPFTSRTLGAATAPSAASTTVTTPAPANTGDSAPDVMDEDDAPPSRIMPKKRF